ncbi:MULTISPECIES: carboxylesterase/lipase family protein [Sphingobium]|uniref:Carboxylic ester hydrolase n=1 Tax=Sphingobium limneticum TaxID=1007511 RepID=A0A5J5I9K3_9SPHN|nr:MULTISPECIES: carboxylesterase/lipase family protein [Sphingobium]KAA9020293.1 carboxylesterase/lipase family protein [Sphingobium limneticum]KAA9021227.1 carboxylesterase/lipase family protein [Sphingobium limneticum]KAA9033588.1 carboxylesterase/lipase family protein [Sphingobium limneticum]BBD03021.1 para-nitrobenzyl esterase [Sphingobium sp. YG1]
MPNRRGFIGAGLTLMASPAFAAASDPVVTTSHGRIRGVREGGLHVFRGVRYGQNTAARRFRAPIAPAPWRDVRPAVAFAPSCPQKAMQAATSEDCLFLNIWTPGTQRQAKRPVLLYIHGGAYSNGSVVDPLNDGRHLAGRDVVVVTVNHRLNALGYLYLAALDPRFADSGNAGQLDLILALRWVRENIASFGGDPANITVFGQSGGGAKIATMMAMPAAKGLFHHAITMSGQQVTASGPINAARRTAAYLTKLGVSPTDLTPLLTMPVARLIDGLDAVDPILGGGLYMGPVLDMRWLKRHPFWPDAAPQGNAIPMMLGNTRDETRAFIDPDGPLIRGLDWANLPGRMAGELRMDLPPEWIVAQYRAHHPDWSAERIFYAATTAGRSWPGQVIEAEARARAAAPTWVYQVDFQSPTQPRRGAPHTMDIALAFGTLDAPGSFTGTGAGARAASAAMMDRFLAFALRGDPNGAGLADWTPYRLDRRSTMIFDIDSHMADDPRGWEREIFAQVPYIQPGS